MYAESCDEELSGDTGWIPWFCGIRGHGLVAEVEAEFIRDNFNLYGLKHRFNFYDNALEMILSNEAPDEENLADSALLSVFTEATRLYGLIHSRFIVSPRGLSVMREKYVKGVFGTCPRVLCQRQHVLPIGISEELCAAKVKMFCPLCEQVYAPQSKYKALDGTYFGESFPQVFLQAYPLEQSRALGLEPPQAFISRLYGFKMHKQKSIIARKLEDEQPSSSAGTGPVN